MKALVLSDNSRRVETTTFGYLRYYTHHYDNAIVADAMMFIAENGGVVKPVSGNDVVVSSVRAVKGEYGRLVALYLRHVAGGRGLVLLLRPFAAAILAIAAGELSGEDDVIMLWREGRVNEIAATLRKALHGRSLAELTRLPVAEAAMLALGAVKKLYGSRVAGGLRAFYGDPYDVLETEWRQLPRMMMLLEYEKIVVKEGAPVYREAAERLAAGEKPREVQDWVCRTTENERMVCEERCYEDVCYNDCWAMECDIVIRVVKDLVVIERKPWNTIIAVVDRRAV